MARAEEARCLYCNGKLPLLRKLTNGQFCSKDHQKDYWKEQERLAVEVLHRTHDALMALRAPAEDIELIIGPAVTWNSEPEPEPVPGPVPVGRMEPRVAEPFREAAAALEQHVETYVSEPYTPEPYTPEPYIPGLAGFATSPDAARLTPCRTLLPHLVAADPVPYEVAVPGPLIVVNASAPRETPVVVNEVAVADSVAVPMMLALLSEALAAATPLEPHLQAPLVTTSELVPQTDWALFAAHVEERFIEVPLFVDFVPPGEPVVVEPIEVGPPLAGWTPMPRLTALPTPAFQIPAGKPMFLVPPMLKPVLKERPAPPAMKSLEPLKEIPLHGAAPGTPAPLKELRWVRLWISYVPRIIPSALQPAEPRVGPAGGCRYAMGPAVRQGLMCRVAPVELVAYRLDVAFPRLETSDWQGTVETEWMPPHAGLVALKGVRSALTPNKPAKGKMAHGQKEGQSAAFASTVLLPQLRLGPMPWPARETPAAQAAAAPVLMAPPLPVPSTGVIPDPTVKTPTPVWKTAIGFWKNAPRDLRLLMFAIPALLALAFHPTLPKVHVSTVQATEPMQKNVGQAVNGSWTSFKQAVSERAAVALDEDFRTGLDDWASPGGATTEWSFDANGFVRPGTLALYSPSLNLTDYQTQFLAIIDKKALSWVVRATDFDNYYVVKLVVVKPGPLTTLGLTRYAVINGQAQSRVDRVVPLTARPDMIYRVKMDIHDDSFALTVQGQMIDAWSEAKLKHGGIGFFSARGEASRVRWLQVTHQYDMLGRLCSYLAPYDLSASGALTTETSTTNGSFKP